MISKTSARSKLLLVIVIIATFSLIVIGTINDGERADVDRKYPEQYYTTTTAGYISSDGIPNYNCFIDSDMTVEFQSDRGFLVSISLVLAPSWSLERTYIYYSYFTTDSHMIPDESILVSEIGGSKKYQYTYPDTGDVLTFNVYNNEIDNVRYEGRTVSISNSSNNYSYLVFDVTVGYQSDTEYVSGGYHVSHTDRTFSITGMENGEEFNGTLDLEYQYSDENRTLYICNPDVDDSALDIVLSDTVCSEASQSTDIHNSRIYRYLEGNVLTTKYHNLTIDGGELMCSGYLLTEQLNEDCVVTWTERVDFDYTGVEI